MEKVINNYGNIGKKSRSNKIHHHAYHRFYPIFLAHYRNISCKLLEIGLENTFSIKIWRDYLPKSFIYGINSTVLSKFIVNVCKSLLFTPINFASNFNA